MSGFDWAAYLGVGGDTEGGAGEVRFPSVPTRSLAVGTQVVVSGRVSDHDGRVREDRGATVLVTIPRSGTFVVARGLVRRKHPIM